LAAIQLSKKLQKNPSEPFEMLARVATGMAASIAFAFAIFLPVPGLFMTAVAMLLVIAAREWAQLCRFSSVIKTVYMLLLFILYSILIWLGRQSTEALLALVTLAFLLWLLSIPLLYFYSKSQSLFANTWLMGFAGLVFMLSTSTGLVWLKSLSQGEWRVVLLVGLVAVADTFAYLAGRKFGKNKLAASISPAKTREGAYGGLFANTLLVGVMILAFDFSGFSNLLLFILVVGASLFSVVGDLVESAVKRSNGVKDSGDLLPGHGGILDRIDGLLAATPFFVLATLLFSPLN
jgi:phosphatidate cytidylyltransferase